ncbi:MAG: AMP-binding protein [Spirochaetes bacterium]|nr:AMP-binding protein [Spirochaetota bacterium]
MKLTDHEKTALVWDDREISYQELLDSISFFEGLYRVAPGERVGIFSENRPEWVYAFFSAWGHGAIALPLDSGLPADDISYILDDSRPSVVFCSSQTREVLEKALNMIGIGPRIIEFERLEGEEAAHHEPVEAGHDEVAVILYTSGTTGNPKGVMLTYNNLLSSIRGIQRLGMITPSDRILGLLPFHHIFPLQGTVIAPLYTGSTSVMVKSLSADEILATMQKYAPTMFLGVPRLYEMFHRGLMAKVSSSLPGRLLFLLSRAIGSLQFSRLLFGKVQRAFGGSVHAYLTGGAKLDDKVARDLRALGFKLVEGYGLTETSPLVAFNPFDAVRPGSVGPVMEGVQVKIVEGQVAVKGPNVMKGYFNRPEETAQRVRDGWFYTGDLGHFDKKGYLHITGRCDEMIVLPSGKNIDPEEIEKRILDLSPAISEIGIMQRDGRLVALVLPDFNLLGRQSIYNFVEGIRSTITKQYNAAVAGFKQISQVTIIREPLPRTRLGKLKRYLMKGIAERREKKSPPAELSGSPEYGNLRRFIEDLTGERVSPDDYLSLDIGMDSLDMLQLSIFIENTYGIPVEEVDYGRYRTLTELSRFVEARRTRIEGGGVDWGSLLSEREPAGMKPGRTFSILRTIIGPLVSPYHRILVSGIEHIPQGPCIFAGNHQSLLDVPMLIRALPRTVLARTFFLAKDKPAYHTLPARLLARGANFIMMDTAGDVKSSMIRIADALRGGCNVVIFPEGTRTQDGTVGEFKKTFAIVSSELEVPVVPFAIDGNFRLMPYGSSFPRPGRGRLSFLDPVYPGGREYQDLTDEVRNAIVRELEHHTKEAGT